tara:strand:+ start:368 stop:1534 length:1167 start_codon:yes stop_codon:yes gene_type:complete
MEYQQWVEECSLLCRWLDAQLGKVTDSLQRSKGFAFYQEGGNAPVMDDLARNNIAKAITQLDYPEQDPDLEKPKDSFAVTCVASDVLEQVKRLNVIKAEFREFHERLRGSYPTGKEGTEVMRIVLKRCGYARLNLENADRIIPTIQAPVTKVTWHYNSSLPSRRRTLNDAIIELRKLQDLLGEPTHDAIEEEIARLEGREFSRSLSVAQVLRNASVQSLRIAYSYMDPEGNRQRELTYGKSPAFVLDQGLALECLPPKEVTGNGVAAGRGRPKVISNRLVSRFLRGWYHYENPSVKTQTSNRKAQNEHAKTGVPGIWFAMNRHGKPVFAFKNTAGVKTTRSILRYGIKEAWTHAIHNMYTQHPVDVREIMIESAPTEGSLERFVDSCR